MKSESAMDSLQEQQKPSSMRFAHSNSLTELAPQEIRNPKTSEGCGHFLGTGWHRKDRSCAQSKQLQLNRVDCEKIETQQ